MSDLQLFEHKKIRSQWNAEEEKWYFSVVDVIEVLTGNARPGKYWNDLKSKLKKEGSELSAKIGQLKMEAEDGKMRDTDVVDTEQLFRLIQSIPSPKAELFKQWLAQVGYERAEESFTQFCYKRYKLDHSTYYRPYPPINSSQVFLSPINKKQ